MGKYSAISYDRGVKYIKNAIKVGTGDLANTGTQTKEYYLGNNDGFSLLVPAIMTAATFKVYTFTGRNLADNADTWLDVTNALFSSSTLGGSATAYTTTVRNYRIKLVYTASNDTNSGKVDLIIYRK